MPPVTSSTRTMPIVAAYQRPVLTPRGTAAAHLSRFQDCWNDLEPADREWFASWLNELLIEAVVPDLPPAPGRGMQRRPGCVRSPGAPAGGGCARSNGCPGLPLSGAPMGGG